MISDMEWEIGVCRFILEKGRTKIQNDQIEGEDHLRNLSPYKYTLPLCLQIIMMILGFAMNQDAWAEMKYTYLHELSNSVGLEIENDTLSSVTSNDYF